MEEVRYNDLYFNKLYNYFKEFKSRRAVAWLQLKHALNAGVQLIRCRFEPGTWVTQSSKDIGNTFKLLNGKIQVAQPIINKY